MKNIFRIISIVAYLSIILAGEIIGIPFCGWLLFVAFDFGNIDQLFAILGIIGIALNFTKRRNDLVVTIISFILMLSPLASRLIQLQIEKFDYWMFEVPFAIFVLTYITFIVMNAIRKGR